MPDSQSVPPIATWLLVSVALYLVATNLSWRIQTRTSGREHRAGDMIRRIAAADPIPAAVGFVYNVGVPYAALLVGVLDPRLAGLIGLDWIRSLTLGVGMTIAIALLWRLNDLYLQGVAHPRVADTVAARSPLTVAWRVVFQQAHWGFYRGGLAQLVGAYGGAFAGLGLVVLEWLADPAWRAGWSAQARARLLAFDMVMALSTTVLFISSGNLWVGGAMHLVLALTVARPHST